jgi:hypothetical protein
VYRGSLDVFSFNTQEHVQVSQWKSITIFRKKTQPHVHEFGALDSVLGSVDSNTHPLALSHYVSMDRLGYLYSLPLIYIILWYIHNMDKVIPIGK